MCRSRRELSNAYLLANFGFDTAENDPPKVCRIPRYFEVVPSASFTEDLGADSLDAVELIMAIEEA